jgi:two-component system, OmpR family, sensor kinase
MRSGFRLPDLSLRVRLLLALVLLAGIGLALADFVSYRALHNYLYDRVDQQLESAVAPASEAVTRQLSPGEVPGLEAGGDRDKDQPPEEPSDKEPQSQLPPGTYAQLRAPNGRVLAQVLFAYGEKGLARPALPGSLRRPVPGARMGAVTVPERGEGSEEFRLTALPGPGKTTLVVAVPLTDTEETLERLAVIELIVSAAILAALAAAAWWLVGIGLRPLSEMGEVAGHIAEGDLSRRVGSTNPRTEVGRLGISLNAMLAQIEAAFVEREAAEARLRQFLADASHELRTPLTAIRGYAELFRIGAQRDPEQVERAMERIESESARMGVLVDDLLTLARIDEVREPERKRLELGPLLADARDDAAAAAPDREVGLELDGSAYVDADENQLRRIFANLLRNAIVHTPAGSPIAVTLTRDGREAVVQVRDHGPGLPPGDTAAVFERFWRSSASRGRADGGAGLGLAIVHAVVEAHGGHVDAANVPGGGAVFTVRLPLSR